MKWFIDTDVDEEYTIIQLQDIRVKPENTMVFLQELVNTYKKLEGSVKK